MPLQDKQTNKPITKKDSKRERKEQKRKTKQLENNEQSGNHKSLSIIS